MLLPPWTTDRLFWFIVMTVVFDPFEGFGPP